MNWSLKLGRLAGIGLYMHWTFPLLIAWVVMRYSAAGAGMMETLVGVALILTLFACVVLHELGHALTARRYGIQTLDITLLPIGGIARLERMPEDPRQEFWVAIAGPAVNVVIAGILFVVLSAAVGFSRITPDRLIGGPFLVTLFWANVLLVAFNALPAFPMDGGRILRSLLARWMDYGRATEIAASIGQAMAILMGFIGLFGPAINPLLILIAVFVFFGAAAESRGVQTRLLLRDLAVRDAMMTKFRTLASADPLAVAVDELLAGSQHDFPVTDNGALLGILRREDVVSQLKEGRRDAPVSEAMKRDPETAELSEPLTQALERMQRSGVLSLPVVQHGSLVGMLTVENVGELMMIRSALKHQNAPETARSLLDGS